MPECSEGIQHQLVIHLVGGHSLADGEMGKAGVVAERDGGGRVPLTIGDDFEDLALGVALAAQPVAVELHETSP